MSTRDRFSVTTMLVTLVGLLVLLLVLTGCAVGPRTAPVETPRTPDLTGQETYQRPANEEAFVLETRAGYLSGPSEAGEQALIEYGYELCPLIREHGAIAVIDRMYELGRMRAAPYNGQMPGIVVTAAATHLC